MVNKLEQCVQTDVQKMLQNQLEVLEGIKKKLSSPAPTDEDLNYILQTFFDVKELKTLHQFLPIKYEKLHTQTRGELTEEIIRIVDKQKKRQDLIQYLLTELLLTYHLFSMCKKQKN